MDQIQIAIICHEANRAYCRTIGDESQPSWDDAPGWQRDSAVKGVLHVLSNPTAPASASHESWMKQKLSEGWKYGPVKDADKKEHPCMVPYAQLPFEQRVKDFIFKNIVLSFTEALEHA